MRDLLAPGRDGMVEGELEQAAAAGAGVDAGGHGHGVRVVVDLHVVLVADVQAFEVLAHHHQVDLVEAPARDDGARRAQVGVELELLAQAHVGRAVAAARGRLQRALQRQARAPDAVERGLGQRVARGLARRPGRRSGGPSRRARSSASSAASVASTISAPIPSPGIRVAGMRALDSNLCHGGSPWFGTVIRRHALPIIGTKIAGA